MINQFMVSILICLREGFKTKSEGEEVEPSSQFISVSRVLQLHFMLFSAILDHIFCTYVRAGVVEVFP